MWGHFSLLLVRDLGSGPCDRTGVRVSRMATLVQKITAPPPPRPPHPPCPPRLSRANCVEGSAGARVGPKKRKVSPGPQGRALSPSPLLVWVETGCLAHGSIKAPSGAPWSAPPHPHAPPACLKGGKVHRSVCLGRRFLALGGGWPWPRGRFPDLMVLNTMTAWRVSVVSTLVLLEWNWGEERLGLTRAG